MPAHIGDVPKYGIDSPEQGIFVESIDFDGQQEIYEQKNNVGKKCGLVIVDEELSFSMSGAVLSTGSSSLKMGGTLALANEIPQIWHTRRESNQILILNNFCLVCTHKCTLKHHFSLFSSCVNTYENA